MYRYITISIVVMMTLWGATPCAVEYPKVRNLYGFDQCANKKRPLPPFPSVTIKTGLLERYLQSKVSRQALTFDELIHLILNNPAFFNTLQNDSREQKHITQIILKQSYTAITDKYSDFIPNIVLRILQEKSLPRWLKKAFIMRDYSPNYYAKNNILHHAALSNDSSILKTIVKSIAETLEPYDIDTLYKSSNTYYGNNTPLVFALNNDALDDDALVAMINAAPTSAIGLSDEYDRNAFHIAARTGRAKVISALIAKTNESYETAAALLIVADKLMKNIPLAIALRNNNQLTINNDDGIIAMIKEAPSTIVMQNSLNRNALHLALEYGHSISVINVILETARAHDNLDELMTTKSAFGQTPLSRSMTLWLTQDNNILPEDIVIAMIRASAGIKGSVDVNFLKKFVEKNPSKAIADEIKQAYPELEHEEPSSAWPKKQGTKSTGKTTPLVFSKIASDWLNAPKYTNATRYADDNALELLALFGLPDDASEDQLRKAYKKALGYWHPDKNMPNAVEVTKKINSVRDDLERYHFRKKNPNLEYEG